MIQTCSHIVRASRGCCFIVGFQTSYEQKSKDEVVVSRQMDAKQRHMDKISLTDNPYE